jgi:hypothetical protein
LLKKKRKLCLSLNRAFFPATIQNAECKRKLETDDAANLKPNSSDEATKHSWTHN